MVNLFAPTAHRFFDAQDEIETIIGVDWFEREQAGERFLSERDFALADVDSDAPTDADWDFFAEVTYVDPMERHF